MKTVFPRILVKLYLGLQEGESEMRKIMQEGATGLTFLFPLKRYANWENNFIYVFIYATRIHWVGIICQVLY